MTHSNMFEEVKCINTLKNIFNYLNLNKDLFIDNNNTQSLMLQRIYRELKLYAD